MANQVGFFRIGDTAAPRANKAAKKAAAAGRLESDPETVG